MAELPKSSALVLVAVLLVTVCFSARPTAAEWEVGFGRGDITPKQPLRLSGYGSRSEPSLGVDTPLHVRCMVLRSAKSAEKKAGELYVLLSVDTIGFPAVFTQEILQAVQQRHAIGRERFVICCTHSHTSPHVARGLGNLFATPPNDIERQALSEYADAIQGACVTAVDGAIGDLKPGRLFTATGEVTFALNRRVLKDGIWAGFGVNPNGPVDHSLPVLKVTDRTGDKLRGLVFNYACHCTTFGGEYNRVNGDWAGYAAGGLERAHPGVTALCAIGCGGDQNPPRDPEKSLQFAQAEGAEIVAEVGRLLAKDWNEITADAVTHFGFASLPIDRPPIEHFRKELNNSRPQVRNHAQIMLEIYDRKKSLPESYPMPIHVWRFGDQFAMVFLGGEVCVDYAHRIRRELGPAKTWVSAYANDVFCYVASERMRPEGGYEVDFSMIYYLQPGRWSSGTEEVILKRVHELYEGQNLTEPMPVSKAIDSFSVPDGYHGEVVAAEPLIAAP